MIATILAPSALARGEIDFDVQAKADLELEARADTRHRTTWDWGDGETSTGASARHRYERAGVYRVVVTAVDDDGYERRAVREIEVKAAAPRAVDVDVDVDGAEVEVEVEHERRASYEWDWGDGHRSRGRIATHAYAEPGTYEVVVKITHADGECTYERRTVVVREGTEVRRETRARGPLVEARVSMSSGSDADEDEWDERVSRYDRSSWYTDASVHTSSSSYDRHDSPGVAAPLVALGAAGVGVAARAWRRR